MAHPNLRIVTDNLEAVLLAIRGTTKKQVLIGIPASNDGRPGGKAGNALIGYVMEHGSPRHNVPARPHLLPGVQAVQKQSLEGLRKAALAALDGDQTAVLKQLSTIGLRAVSSVRSIITARIPPPLAAGTVAARLRRSQQGRKRLSGLRGQGTDLAGWGAGNLTPLVDTGSYLKALTYVVRDALTGKELKGGDNG